MRVYLFLACLFIPFGFAAAEEPLPAQPEQASESAEFGLMHENIMNLARDNLHKALDEKGNFYPKETEAEKAVPIISNEDGAMAIRIGTRSAIAQWCGVDWNTGHYLKFMRHARNSSKWNERQLAYISVIHGLTMGIIDRQLKHDGECPASERKRIQTFIQDWAPDFSTE